MPSLGGAILIIAAVTLLLILLSRLRRQAGGGMGPTFMSDGSVSVTPKGHPEEASEPGENTPFDDTPGQTPKGLTE